MLTADETQDKDRPLRETVRDTLRTRIFEGHYAPGTRLVERDLAAEFSVSRLPVREAHGWLFGRIEDPFGHHWEIGKPLSEWPPSA